MVQNTAENGNATILNGYINNSITNSFIEELLKNIKLAKEDVPSANNELSSSFDDWTELLKKKSSQKGEIDLDALRDSNNETLLCFLIRNRTLWNVLSQEDRDLLVDKSDINYTYSGPFDKAKQRIQFDNYLHIAARVSNTDAFLFIFKKSIENNIRLLEYNDNRENPFHIAAKARILPAVVKGVFEHFKLTANEIKRLESSIEKAKKAGLSTKEDQEELRKVKEKLKNDKSYIVEALRSKCALNKYKETPLDCISKTEKKDIKKDADIQDKLICDKNFHLCLYIVGAILSIAALCLSLYFLFMISETFALSSMASMAFAGVTYLSIKACTEIHDLHNEDASMQDVRITQVSEDIGVSAG